jgi:hypothetical protein
MTRCSVSDRGVRCPHTAVSFGLCGSHLSQLRERLPLIRTQAQADSDVVKGDPVIDLRTGREYLGRGNEGGKAS